MDNFSKDSLNNLYSLGIGVLANLFFFIMISLFTFLRKKLNLLRPRSMFVQYIYSCIVWIICTIAIGCSFYMFSNRLIPFLSLISLSMLFCYVIWKLISQVSELGVLGADKSAIDGIDFEKSLKMCNSQISFLGIGASKLTNSKEFEKALKRCKSQKPIRFLLLHPADDNLITAAKKAGKDKDSFHELVINSLKNIASLKNNRELNIQVRFYKGPPYFRLMFIDDTLCLLSSYANFGENDGSNQSQIYLHNRNGNHSKSFYSAFDFYYEKTWDSADIWNFKDFI